MSVDPKEAGHLSRGSGQNVESLAPHLRRYVVDQDYEKYTFEDQAVWRFILRQLRSFLSQAAHPCYLEGLTQTGISIDKIPSIAQINDSLEKFGWRALPVSGFIPPAAFMEFQSLGILPIASDIRTKEHLAYTPAPDIVHEAAGHAPILVNADFASYLRRYAEVATHAIVNLEDLSVYQAIRDLSDLKESSVSTPDQISAAEKKLLLLTRSVTKTSEATLLSRMNWWTSEYGLIGSLASPKIYGAGLLSSLGEARSCLSAQVKKIPLSIDCLNFSYDITEPQPQLFVAPDFTALHDVLGQLESKMAFRVGGLASLEKALQSQTVSTVELNSGLQISGELVSYEAFEGQVSFVRYQGPCQLSVRRRQIPGHGPKAHQEGFSSPLGALCGPMPSLNLTEAELALNGVRRDQRVHLKYQSGIELMGRLTEVYSCNGLVCGLAFEDCRVFRGSQILFDPTWGRFDLAVGASVVAVFGGPADRSLFEPQSDFCASRVGKRQFTDSEITTHQLYFAIRQSRESAQTLVSEKFEQLSEKFYNHHSHDWLLGLELLELLVTKTGFGKDKNLPGGNANSQPQWEASLKRIKRHLAELGAVNPSVNSLIQQGMELAGF